MFRLIKHNTENSNISNSHTTNSTVCVLQSIMIYIYTFIKCLAFLYSYVHSYGYFVMSFYDKDIFISTQ